MTRVKTTLTLLVFMIAEVFGYTLALLSTSLLVLLFSIVWADLLLEIVLRRCGLLRLNNQF